MQQREAERDQIQANLLELDASFGKRLLEGGSLTGTTRLRWGAAAADLTSVWDTFASYAWLYIGSWAVGLGAFLIAMTFRPFPKAAIQPASMAA